MKQFISAILAFILCGTLIASAVDAPKNVEVTLDFSKISEITKKNNQTIQALNKKVEALKIFDFFDKEQNKMFDQSQALGQGQEQLNSAINQSAATGGTINSSTLNLLQKSIQANTSAIQALLSAFATYHPNTTKYSNLMQCYVDEIADQLASGAETLYITYDYLNALQSELTRKQNYLEYSLEKAQATYNAGMMTKVELIELQQNREVLKNGIENSRQLQKMVLSNLKAIMGYDSSAEVTLTSLPEIDLTSFEELDYKTDFETAHKANHTLKAEKQSLDMAQSDADKDSISSLRMLDSAKIELAQAEKQFYIDFQYVWDNLLINHRALTLEASKYAVQQEKLRTASAKHTVGLLSRLELNTALDEAESQHFSLMQAKIQYFKAWQKYQWALRGLLDSSLEGLKQQEE